MSDDEERRLRWVAHCHRMAEATSAVADWCEDPEMMAAYIDLAAQWLRMAEEPPRAPALGRAEGALERRNPDLSTVVSSAAMSNKLAPGHL